MNLRELLKLCQNDDHSHEWVRLPSGPVSKLLTGFTAVAFATAPPALAAHQPNYVAVHVPDPSLMLAWGYQSEDWREERDRREREDWQPENFKSVREQFALVFYNGAPVWQVRLAYADWGSGIGMAVPWPRPEFREDREDPIYWTTRWEVEFAWLLSSLQGETRMDLIRFMTDPDGGVVVREIEPITVELERL
jgi:hypothetical protein